MHAAVEEAMEQIDAMMFCGDPSNEDLDQLQVYVDRWTRQIPKTREMNDEFAAMDEKNED